MSGLLRMAWMFATQSRGRKADLAQTTRVHTRTLPSDLDLNRHVNNGRYLQLADLGRFDWFYRTGVMQAAARVGAFPVIGDVTARYLKQMGAFEKLEIDTRLLGFDARWLYLETRLLTARGELAALVTVRGLFWSPRGKPVPAAVLADAAQGTFEAPELPSWVRLWAKALDALSDSARKQPADGDLERAA